MALKSKHNIGMKGHNNISAEMYIKVKHSEELNVLHSTCSELCYYDQVIHHTMYNYVHWFH